MPFREIGFDLPQPCISMYSYLSNTKYLRSQLDHYTSGDKSVCTDFSAFPSAQSNYTTKESRSNLNMLINPLSIYRYTFVCFISTLGYRNFVIPTDWEAKLNQNTTLCSFFRAWIIDRHHSKFSKWKNRNILQTDTSTFSRQQQQGCWKWN